ncbi:MAG: hypothetical protein HUJ51_05085 [Eggerthellaceae bacterium]|nr:hypothetical protein [Eggerthellaceae bacterium]
MGFSATTDAQVLKNDAGHAEPINKGGRKFAYGCIYNNCPDQKVTYIKIKQSDSNDDILPMLV